MLDADLDCGGLIIFGTFMWDIDVDDKELRANFVLVEGDGVFKIGDKSAPMLGKATIYIKDSDAQHPHVGRRFLAGYNGYTPSMTNLNEDDFNTVAKKDATGAGPLISFYGRPLERTWTLLSKTMSPGDLEMHVKDDHNDLGWRVGDEIAISYTSGHVGHRTKIAKIAPAVAIALDITATAASHSDTRRGETADDFSKATDGDENSNWSSFDHIGTEAKDPANTWLDLKLDGVKEVNSITVSWRVPPRKFRVLTKAAANDAWKSESDVVEVFAGKYCPPMLNGDQTEKLSGYTANCYSGSTGFTTAAQFIRIEMVEFTSDSKWVMPIIGEVTAKGKPVGATLPKVFFLEDSPAEPLLGGFREYDGEAFEMAGEVMNLQRSIQITGDTDGFVDGAKQGLHTMMFGGKMIVDHTRVEFCGQRNVLGRYCLHWHHVGRCPDCRFDSNAIVDGQTKGLVIHGTHNATAHNNVLWNSRGVGVYTEDGNEMHNTISNNVVSCEDKSICHVAEISAMYVVAFHNNFLNNHVSAYSNGIFFPGAGGGQGNARGRVCTSLSPFGTVKGNVNHDSIRFGFYLDNDFPRRLKRDSNGMLADKSSCDAMTADGRDNGAFTVIEDLFEWQNGATGQYSCGDIQYLRLTAVNQVGQYWKVSKVFASGDFAHVKDSLFVNSHIMGPAGQ